MSSATKKIVDETTFFIRQKLIEELDRYILYGEEDIVDVEYTVQEESPSEEGLSITHCADP